MHPVVEIMFYRFRPETHACLFANVHKLHIAKFGN